MIYHSENGLVGRRPGPHPGPRADPELIDASKRLVTAAPGAAFFEQTDSPSP